MLFNSFHFLFFFPIVVCIFYKLSFQYRLIFLLLASYYFYMVWKPVYILLVLLSTVVDYLVALKLNCKISETKRRYWLSLSLVCNLGILFIFKYYDFFRNDVIGALFHLNTDRFFTASELILPMGISFYTFQTISYTIDVYRKKINPEKNFFEFALYVSFFPQLVAGPIERSSKLLPQFKKKEDFNLQGVIWGLKKMGWGFFKKVIIADRLGVAVNTVYGNPTQYTGWYLIIATICFSFQIFFDFSGYSDIAIGAAKVLGYDLMENFNKPYLSKSIPEFWKRWHISLSTWFRDYVYIPLGGSKKGLIKTVVNLLVTFAISGLWHGANWTFLFWGLLHGFYLVLYKGFNSLKQNFHMKETDSKRNIFMSVLQISITFLLVSFAWIFFRANTVNDAIYIVSNLLVGVDNLNISDVISILLGIGLQKLDILILAISLTIVAAEQIFYVENSKLYDVINSSLVARWSVYYVIIFILLFCLPIQLSTEFIYFQF